MERPILIKAYVPIDIHRRLKAFAGGQGLKVGEAVQAILGKHLPPLRRRTKK